MVLEYAGESGMKLPREPLINTDGELVRDEEVVFASATGEDEHEGIRRFAARNERWKAVLERKVDSGEIISEAVYDLEDDSQEQSALHPGERDTAGLVKRLRALSASRIDSTDDSERDKIGEAHSTEVDERLEALGYK
jgi:hypothetical protein